MTACWAAWSAAAVLTAIATSLLLLIAHAEIRQLRDSARLAWDRADEDRQELARRTDPRFVIDIRDAIDVPSWVNR